MGIISEEVDWITVQLEKLMEKYDIRPIFIKPSRIVSSIGLDFKLKLNNRDILDLDCVFVRNIGEGPEMFYRFDALKYLENYVPLINPTDGIENAGNKYRTSFLMEVNGIPSPRTVVTEDINKALTWTEQFGDCVLKPLFGNQGKGIVRLNHRSMVSKLNVLNNFKSEHGVFYIQEFVNLPKNHGYGNTQDGKNTYRDIRAFVIGDEVVSAMYRVSNNWITNIHRDGTPEKCEITNELEKIAVKAKNAVGLVYGGVDLIESEEGLKVLEVNGTPSWEGLSSVSEEDIAERLIEEAIKICK